MNVFPSAGTWSEKDGVNRTDDDRAGVKRHLHR